jgi:protein ImuB
MKRVAALYLPDWSIERVKRRNVPLEAGASEQSSTAPVRSEANAAPRPAGARSASDGSAGFARGRGDESPHTGGWRPGARWAKADVQTAIATLPSHQRPPVRELGRLSEAVDHPFKRLRGDDGAAPYSSPARGAGPPQTIRSRPAPSISSAAPPPRAGEELALVLTHRIGSRVEIAAACPHARALGVRPGMALTQARIRTPGLVVRDADHAGDASDLRALALLLARRFAPIVAIDGTAGLLIDITGTAHLHGGEAAMARRLVGQLARRGYTARVAIAATPGAAHALARHGTPAIAIPDDATAALAPLPTPALRIGTAAVELLRRLGIDTIGQLAAVARGPLARRFGPGIVTRLDQAHGRLPEPLDPVIPAEPIACRQAFVEPIATVEAIEHWLGVLVPRLTTALTAAGLGARRIEVIADRVDTVPQRIRIGLARPNRDPAHILRLLVRRIGDVEPGYGIDAITLHLRAADPLGPESLNAELSGDIVPDIAPLVDILATRGSALWRHRPVESDVPERSVARAAPLDPPARVAHPLKADDVRRLDLTATLHPWHPRWPRPVRLLARPEPLDHVLAEMPDKAPLRFTWRGTGHRVVRADGPERIAGEWWRRSGERSAIRDYFHVEDDTGARFWLYRRGDGERAETGDLRWFLHGWFG